MVRNGNSERRQWLRVEARTQVLLYKGRKLLGRGFTENFSKGGAFVRLQLPAGSLDLDADVRVELALPRGMHGNPRSIYSVARVLRVAEGAKETSLALRFVTVSLRNSSDAMKLVAMPPKTELALVGRSRSARN